MGQANARKQREEKARQQGNKGRKKLDNLMMADKAETCSCIL
jgi:hypothetical protein